MWKQAQSLFAEEEYDDSQDNLLEEAEGLCSLSPTQVLLYPIPPIFRKFPINHDHL